MAIDPAHTAVVLIEYQNDFTTEGGVLHGAVRETMEHTSMLENTRRVVDAQRLRERVPGTRVTSAQVSPTASSGHSVGCQRERIAQLGEMVAVEVPTQQRQDFAFVGLDVLAGELGNGGQLDG